MKKFLLLAILAIGATHGSFAQDLVYSYSFSIDTVSNTDNSKDVLTGFSQVFDVRTKRITGKHSFYVESIVNASEEYFGLLLSSLGYQMTHFEKLKTRPDAVTEKTSPGGTDCGSASIVCSNDAFAGTATNYGVQELNASNEGCLYGENQSSWYYINVAIGGTLSMLIDPANNSDDYDFAIWGPFTTANAAANCPPVSNPIRCSYSSKTDLTGLQSSYYGQTSSFGCGFLGLFACYGTVTVSDNSESASGDSYVQPLNVNAGQIYILLVDNYSSSGYPYNLSWGGTAVLDCTPVILPVELVSFEGRHSEGHNMLTWITASEHNNDYFTLERSSDNQNWSLIGKVSGAGYSETEQQYTFDDTYYSEGVNYYRLSQVDFNGSTRYFESVYIDNSPVNKEIVKVIDMMGKEVREDYTGPRIILFSDGSTMRTIGQ